MLSIRSIADLTEMHARVGVSTPAPVGDISLVVDATDLRHAEAAQALLGGTLISLRSPSGPHAALRFGDSVIFATELHGAIHSAVCLAAKEQGRQVHDGVCMLS